jgi:D-sedoheptulose 7-phosphate isomerase
VTSLTGLQEALTQNTAPVPASGFAAAFVAESIAIMEQVDVDAIERMAAGLARVREFGGRLFILGVGGSAGHAGHAVNDFRKLCCFEAYAPTDNVSELTARANDEGWDTCFAAWLTGSRIGPRDGVLVFSVGGGSREKNVSVNIVRALETASEAGAHIFGIVGGIAGLNGGFTRQVSEECIVIPPLAPDRITPHTEGLCAVLWHLLVSHPLLQRASTKWESVR